MLLHENNDDEGKCNDVLFALSFSSYPSWTRHESNSPPSNPLGVIANSFFSLIRPLIMRTIGGCIKALPLPVKSFVVTSIDQLKPLVDTIASLDTLDVISQDDNLLRLTLPTEFKIIVVTSSELVVDSSTGLVTINDQDTLVGIDDEEENYFPNALTFLLIGCLIILLALGCGIIRSDTAILCLGIFQAMILEYNYQMISSFVAVVMKCLVVIFTTSSNVDLDDADKVVEGEELAVSTLRSSSELIIPIDITTAIVDRSYSSDVSIEPYKSCLVALLLLIFTSLVEIVDTLSVIDWLILITLVGSTMLISTASSKRHVLGSGVESTITTFTSSALDDVDTYHPVFDIQSQETTTSVPFNLMCTLRACLSSGLQHIFYERHDLLVAFLLMTCAPIPVMVAVMMVLFDFWTVIQALVVATCLMYATSFTSKALQSIPTRLRRSTNALVGRVYRFDPITTICNIITTESFLLNLLLMVIVPLIGIAVIMMMLILASFNWSLVIQVLVEWTMIIPSCLISVRQACGVVMLMMCLKLMTYYLLRMWQYQLSIALTFLDTIGSSGSLVNFTKRLFIMISLALAYYDDNGGGDHSRGGMLHSATVHTVTPPRGLMNTARDILYSAITRTLNSIWMTIHWVVKKFVYLIAYTSILLIHVIIMLVQSIDYKAVMYTSVTYLVRMPINIVWRFLGRLAAALFGCIVYLYAGIKLFILNISNRVEQKEQKEEPLPPPPAIAVSDDEESDDDSIDFGAADLINDCVDQDISLPPPPPPKRRARRRRKEYPPAVWHRGRGGRGGRLRPRPPKPG